MSYVAVAHRSIGVSERVREPGNKLCRSNALVLVCTAAIFRHSYDKERTRCPAFSRTPPAILPACSPVSSCALYASREPKRRPMTGKSAPKNSARDPDEAVVADRNNERAFSKDWKAIAKRAARIQARHANIDAEKMLQPPQTNGRT